LAGVTVDCNLTIYCASNFSERGDVARRIPGNDGQFSFTPIAEYPVSSTVINLMNDFTEKMNKRGVVVLFAYPAIAHASVEGSIEQLRQLHYRLNEQLDMPILGGPEQFVFDDNLMYDTPYHLGLRGREIRTLRLAELLKDYLG
jgi:hypothetical protein